MTVVVLCVCVSVCLSVCHHIFCHCEQQGSHKRYQRVRRYTGLIFNLAIFVKILRSKVWCENHVNKPICNEFRLTADGFRALSRSTMHGDYSMDNWLIERYLRGRLQVRSEKIDRRWEVAHAAHGDRYAHAQHFRLCMSCSPF